MLTEKNIKLEYWWAFAQKGIEGHEQANQQATKAADKHRGQYTNTVYPLPKLDYVSFAHNSRRLTEVQWAE